MSSNIFKEDNDNTVGSSSRNSCLEAEEHEEEEEEQKEDDDEEEKEAHKGDSLCKTLNRLSINSDYESDSTESFCSCGSETSESSGFVQCFQNGADFGDKVVCAQQTQGTEIIRRIFSQQNEYQNIQIERSSNVQLGNVANIYGDVHINTSVTMINQQTVTNHLFLEVPTPVKHGELSIIYREGWLALAPVQERKLLDGPAKFVIIYHTVSQANNDQASNTRTVQAIQRFHMTKRNFDDIAYNFLIGSDGNVYEGRGWSVVGSHTPKYNKFSVGIAFIGYFEKKLPPLESLKQAQVLMQRGIQMGAIDKNYKLLAHCQCSETESPGAKLYQEIQKWENWDGNIDTLHPSPLILD